jgi:hypothetical protein
MKDTLENPLNYVHCSHCHATVPRDECARVAGTLDRWKCITCIEEDEQSGRQSQDVEEEARRKP